MLIRFVASNFMSIGKECEFNMLPAPLHSHQHHVYSNTTKRIKILKGAAIYGANGAGKSNIIKAIHFLQTAVLSGDIIPNTSRLQYKLDEEVASRPTVFDIEFEWHRKFYGYHLEIQKDIIVEESLYELGFKNDDKLLFERRFSEHNQKICVELGGTKVLSSRNRLLETLLAENILDNRKLLLSNHSMLNNKKVSNAFEWFGVGLLILFPNSKFTGMAKSLSNSTEFSSFANSVITTFDTGVTQIGINTIPLDEFFGEDNTIDKRILIDHLNQTRQDIPIPLRNGSVVVASIDEHGDYIIKKPITYHKDSSNHKVMFDIIEESDGTQRLLDIIPAINMYLNSGMTIIIDEVDESLHPSLLKAIMKKIMDSNPKEGGQFIVTTHESNLLDADIYRQDEIWFVEKHNGMTELYPLTDFSPRADLQLQKGYLMGRFGAIPFLADLRNLNW